MKNKIMSVLLLLAFVVGQYSCNEDELARGISGYISQSGRGE